MRSLSTVIKLRMDMLFRPKTVATLRALRRGVKRTTANKSKSGEFAAPTAQIVGGDDFYPSQDQTSLFSDFPTQGGGLRHGTFDAPGPVAADQARRAGGRTGAGRLAHRPRDHRRAQCTADQ